MFFFYYNVLTQGFILCVLNFIKSLVLCDEKLNPLISGYSHALIGTEFMSVVNCQHHLNLMSFRIC